MKNKLKIGAAVLLAFMCLYNLNLSGSATSGNQLYSFDLPTAKANLPLPKYSDKLDQTGSYNTTYMVGKETCVETTEYMSEDCAGTGPVDCTGYYLVTNDYVTCHY